eukprot:1158575-Amphidinium_carterae.2
MMPPQHSSTIITAYGKTTCGYVVVIQEGFTSNLQAGCCHRLIQPAASSRSSGSPSSIVLALETQPKINVSEYWGTTIRKPESLIRDQRRREEWPDNFLTLNYSTASNVASWVLTLRANATWSAGQHCSSTSVQTSTSGLPGIVSLSSSSLTVVPATSTMTAARSLPRTIPCCFKVLNFVLKEKAFQTQVH